MDTNGSEWNKQFIQHHQETGNTIKQSTSKPSKLNPVSNGFSKEEQSINIGQSQLDKTEMLVRFSDEMLYDIFEKLDLRRTGYINKDNVNLKEMTA